MDPLAQTLLDRQAPPVSQPSGDKTVIQPPNGMPTTIPDKPQGLPPAWQRWLVSQKMQAAYRNGWQPNPMLIQANEHSKK